MRPGDVFADRFEIEALAGQGAMGAVYRARDRVTGGRVALKTLRDGGSEHGDRFVREGRILAELTHPAIVGYVAHGATAGGELYLGMEWLEGEDLSHRFQRSGLTLAETLALGVRAAGALGAAHARGVVHRDIKPSNIFLPGGDVSQAKILDFGIARMGHGSLGNTRTGIMVGTPGYMSPEQARGLKTIDVRADVFSLGCVLYQCLAGRPPFVADDLFAILAKLVFEEPPRVTEHRPDIPPAVDELVMRMLSKSPDGRPANGDQVAKALAALAADLAEASPEAAGVDDAPAITAAEQRLMSVVVASGSPVQGELDEARVGEAVRPFGAEVVALMDGALMVTLAADGEPTDQAAQASRCALAMGRVLAGRDMVLATGRRVLGGRVPFGEVIDRAVAMLRSAEAARSAASSPGMTTVTRLRVDEVTAGLLDSRFVLGGDALSLFLIEEREELESAARTLLGRVTPCVGRDRELGTLDATLTECVSEPVARAVVVTAPVGMGKSRLRYELLRRLAERGNVVRPESPPVEVWIARGDPMGKGSPFRMVGQAVRRTAGLLDGESLSVRRQKLRARVARHLGGADLQRVSEFLGELCGVPFPDDDSVQLRAARQDPMRMGDQMARAFEDFLAAECRGRPLLIVLEDLHWGDLPSVQWLDSALRNLHDRPLMILALARPEVNDLFPQLWSSRGVSTMALGELTRKASEKLVRLVLGERVRAEVVNEIVERAGGNAFYLEELIRAVAEGRGDRLPVTVLAMVQARLDRLEPDARRVLRAASVFGQVFWAGGVAALLGAEAITMGATPPNPGSRLIQPREWLDELEKREIIVPRASEKFPDEREYAFRNAPVRDAAYASFTDEDRELGHRLAASFLEAAGEADAVVLAEHMEKGGEPGRAVGHYVRGAEQALEGNDFAAALDRVARGMACGAKGEARGALASIRAEAQKWLGDNVEAEASGVEALAHLTVGSAPWFKALADLATVRAKMGQHEPLLALAGELMPMAPTSTTVRPGMAAVDTPAAYATAVARVAIQLLHTGHLDVADGLLARAETAATRAQAEPAMLASIYQARAIRAMFWGDVGAFLGFMTAAAEHFERAGDLRSAGTQRANQAYAYSELGAYEAAERWLRHVLDTAERMGLRDLAAGTRHNLGIALARRGMLDEARAVETAAVRVSVSQRNRRLESGCRTYLSIILLLSGDLAGAEREARAAVDILSVAPPIRAHACGTLSRVLLAMGRAEEALVAAEEAMRLMHSVSGVEEGESLIRLAYAEALIANNRDARGAVAVAADRLRQRAEQISDPAWRASFLEHVPDNARITELSRMYGRT